MWAHVANGELNSGTDEAGAIRAANSAVDKAGDGKPKFSVRQVKVLKRAFGAKK